MGIKEDIIIRLRENSNCSECHVDYKWRQNCCGSTNWIISTEEAEIIINDVLEKEGEQNV